jgi:hypothetical protein
LAFTVNFRNIRTLFGKTKKRSQMCLVASEDGRLIPVEILVRKGCAVDDEKVSAFLLDADNQVRDEATNLSYQLVGERTCVPICLLKHREEFKRVNTTTVDGKPKSSDSGLWKLIKGVFHDSWVTDLIMMSRMAAMKKKQSMVYLLLASVVPLTALVIAIKVIRG